MLSAEVITSVVTRGLSLRINVPGEMVVRAMRAFPFPGRESTFHRFCSGVIAVTGSQFLILEMDEDVEGKYWRSEMSGAIALLISGRKWTFLIPKFRYLDV